jgi:hypothetical protein
MGSGVDESGEGRGAYAGPSTLRSSLGLGMVTVRS